MSAVCFVVAIFFSIYGLGRLDGPEQLSGWASLGTALIYFCAALWVHHHDVQSRLRKPPSQERSDPS